MIKIQLVSNIIDLDTFTRWEYTEEPNIVKDYELLIMFLNEADFTKIESNTNTSTTTRIDEIDSRYFYNAEQNIIYVSLYCLYESSRMNINPLETRKNYKQFLKVLKKLQLVK